MIVFTSCLSLLSCLSLASGSLVADIPTPFTRNVFYFDEDVTLNPADLATNQPLPETQNATSASANVTTAVAAVSEAATASPVPLTSTSTPAATTRLPSSPFVSSVATSEAPRTTVTPKPSERPSQKPSKTPAPTPQPTAASIFPHIHSRDPVGTRFFLYTRYHSISPYVLDQNSEDSLKGAFFTFCYNENNLKRLPARDKKVYIVIHGLSDGYEVTTWMKGIKSRLLEADREANVVLVDWSRGASVNLLNDLKFSSVRIVGQQIVYLIRGLQYLYPATFSPDNVHIIAHSFGTFAADVTGRNIRGIGRITGLDPTGEIKNLHSLPPSQRLDPSDAKFVDVIHTGATAPSGTSPPLGHFDFYPNGGYAQPGCNPLATSPAASFLRPLLPSVGLGGTQSGNSLKKLLSCSHSRAIDLFIESIRHRDAPGCRLVSYACSNYTAFVDAKCTICKEGSENQEGEACALLGFHAVDSFNAQNFQGNKKFYITTNKQSPYCLYHYGVAVKIAKKPKNHARGGVLIASLEGEYVSSLTEPNLEVKLLGGLNGFKPGKIVRAMFTHYDDIGTIKSAALSWVPSHLGHLISPALAPTLYVQAAKVYPMSFEDASTRKAAASILCPPTTPLSGFLSEFLPSLSDPPVASISAVLKEVEFSPRQCRHHNQQLTFRGADAHFHRVDLVEEETSEIE